jgi:hypothetical protein
MSGYIKFHRGWHDCDVFNASEPYCERAAWAWLLTNAAWKDATRRTGQGAIVKLTRGQIHVSLASLASAWGWSIKRVRGFIDRLEKGHMVGTAKDKTGTVLTISNYEKYQGDGPVGGTPRGTEKGTAGAQPGHTQEEDKEDKNTARAGALPCPGDVDLRVWADFLALRKAKRAPLSETALARIEGEAAKAGWTLSDALAECVVRGWQAFKAEWVSAAANDQAEAKKFGNVW